MFNMAVMRADVLDAYCSWLFETLAQVEGRLDFSGMTPFAERCVGRLAEMLLDVWLSQERVAFREVRIRELEGVNWLRKGSAFLAAKFLGKRYDASF